MSSLSFERLSWLIVYHWLYHYTSDFIGITEPTSSLLGWKIRQDLDIKWPKMGVYEVVWRRILGGAEGIRTPDLLNAIEALSQLSYSPLRFQYYQLRWWLAKSPVNTLCRPATVRTTHPLSRCLSLSIGSH